MNDANGIPVLWHLKVSHYNEKARWALDHKRVLHRRKAVEPGRHSRVAKRLWGGWTFPVLELNGSVIGDSTEIIAALERERPDPALYPADEAERRRALELEDFFDEELGPYTRRLVMHHTSADPKLFLGTFTPDMGAARRRVVRAAFPLIRRRVRSDFGIDDTGVAEAYEKLRLAGERFRSELGPSGYLVADRFTVADLTAAAMVAPAIAPEQFPYPQPQRGHELLAELHAAIAEFGIADWARGIYARHRGTSSEVGAQG